MHDPALDVTFEAGELQDGSAWYVRLPRPEMLPLHIGEFKTQAEVREWTRVKPAKWLVRTGAS